MGTGRRLGFVATAANGYLLPSEHDLGRRLHQCDGLGRHQRPIGERRGAPRLRRRVALVAGPHQLVDQGVPGPAAVDVLVGKQQVSHQSASSSSPCGPFASQMASSATVKSITSSARITPGTGEVELTLGAGHCGR